MTGAEMMLKAMGINPSDLIGKIEEFGRGMQIFSARAEEIAALTRDTHARVMNIETEVVMLRLTVNGMAQSRGALLPVNLPDDIFAGNFGEHPMERG